MNEQASIHYDRIAKAISFIHENFREQPSLEEIAIEVNLSPFHFQRLFTEWAGVSPKKFLQYITIQYAKNILSNPGPTLFETADKTGLSGTGRLHDLFVNIEAMTPGEYKNKGADLRINYSYSNSLFGEILIASTQKGICYMGFVDKRVITFQDLQDRYPKATYIEKVDKMHENALKIYSSDWTDIDQIKLHLKGTDFQLNVWEALLKIPSGDLSTYGNIAKNIQRPKASRAVGTAIGKNPIAFLIPCHRVIQSSGIIGGYMWGPTRKRAIIGWEAGQINKDNNI